MLTAWTHHLRQPEEKADFEKSLHNSKWILEHLRLLLEDMDKSLDKQEISPRAYDNPNWAYRQAHLNGFKQCLNKVKTLIDLDNKEETHDRDITTRTG